MLRVVSPYRPFPISKSSHKGVDWIAALGLLRRSAAQFDADVWTITDVDTTIPGQTFAYVTHERALMLWILEVSLAYLSSPDFDQDTVMVSPDTLVVGDLRPYFAGDVTILVRAAPRYLRRPVLNAAQWWPIKAKDRLIAFYTAALAVARTLSPSLIAWGADCDALRSLIAPIQIGLHKRAGLLVSMLEAKTVMQAVSNATIRALAGGWDIAPIRGPIVDFKHRKKCWQQPYFDAVCEAAR